MVIKGKTRGNGKQLANYLLTKGENENIRVLDIRGTSQPDDLRASLLEMSLTSELTKSGKGLLHAQINPAVGEDQVMTREDWLRSADILETELKLTGQKRAIVMHEKNGRFHAHVVWERYDHEKGIMISDSYNRYAQDRARQTIEKEFGQKRTPERNANKANMKVELTALWNKHRSADAFIKEAEKRGYLIATGRDRPYIVVDKSGRSFDLIKSLDKIKMKDVGERFKTQQLPTEKKALLLAKSKKTERGLNDNQEKFVDRINSFKEKRAAEKEKQQMLKDKAVQMKQEGKHVTNESIDTKQDYFIKGIKKFRESRQEESDHLPDQTYDQKQPQVKYPQIKTAGKLNAMQEDSKVITQPENESEIRKRKFRENLEVAKKGKEDQEKDRDPEFNP